MVVNLTRYDLYSDFDETGTLQTEVRPVTEGEFVKFKEVEGLLLKQSGEAPVQQLKAKISAWRQVLLAVGPNGFTQSGFDKLVSEMAETSAV